MNAREVAAAVFFIASDIIISSIENDCLTTYTGETYPIKALARNYTAILKNGVPVLYPELYDKMQETTNA